MVLLGINNNFIESLNKISREIHKLQAWPRPYWAHYCPQMPNAPNMILLHCFVSVSGFSSAHLASFGEQTKRNGVNFIPELWLKGKINMEIMKMAANEKWQPPH